MSKSFFSLGQFGASRVDGSVFEDPMFYSYHHGLCPQGRIALGIDAAYSRRVRQAKLLDAVAVGLWGTALMGLLWLL